MTFDELFFMWKLTEISRMGYWSRHICKLRKKKRRLHTRQDEWDGKKARRYRAQYKRKEKRRLARKERKRKERKKKERHRYRKRRAAKKRNKIKQWRAHMIEIMHLIHRNIPELDSGYSDYVAEYLQSRINVWYNPDNGGRFNFGYFIHFLKGVSNEDLKGIVGTIRVEVDFFAALQRIHKLVDGLTLDASDFIMAKLKTDQELCQINDIDSMTLDTFFTFLHSDTAYAVIGDMTELANLIEEIIDLYENISYDTSSSSEGKENERDVRNKRIKIEQSKQLIMTFLDQCNSIEIGYLLNQIEAEMQLNYHTFENIVPAMNHILRVNHWTFTQLLNFLKRKLNQVRHHTVAQ